MIGYLDIMKAEAIGESVFPFSDEGKWYPDINDLLPTNVVEAQKNELNNLLKERGMNREQRRKKRKEAFGQRGVKSKARSPLAAAHQSTIDELRKVFPLSQVELEMLANFARTGGNRNVVKAALRRVLADPSWIIERLATHPSDLGVALGWLRPAGAKLAHSFGEIANRVIELDQTLETSLRKHRTDIDLIDDFGVKSELLEKISASTQGIQDQKKQRWKKLVLSCTNAFVEATCAEAGFAFHAAMTRVEAQTRFPGIFAAVSVSLHATKRAAAQKGRTLANSDYGDMLHAVYAPYVDLFRPDGFMKDAISEAVTSQGIVVPRLTELPEAIERRLSRIEKG